MTHQRIGLLFRQAKLFAQLFQRAGFNRIYNSVFHRFADLIFENKLAACDLIAEGIIGAVEEVGVTVPVVVRLEGNNAEKGSDILADSGLNIIAATSLKQAAESVVAAAGGAE